MLNIEILPLKISDISEVLEIEKECFSSESWSEKTLKESVLSDAAYFICAKLDFKLIGYAGIYWVLEEGYVYNLAVDKNFRGLKVATSLINNLFNYSKSIGLKFLSLEVRKSNEIAISLYKKLGFKILGIRKNFYSLPKEDAIIMTRYFEV